MTRHASTSSQFHRLLRANKKCLGRREGARRRGGNLLWIVVDPYIPDFGTTIKTLSMLESNVVNTFDRGRFRKSYDNVKLISSRLRQNRYNQIISQIAIEKDALRNAFKEKLRVYFAAVTQFCICAN